MNSKIATIRPARPGEIDLLRNIDKEARRRYLSLKGFKRFADSPPIKAERFNGGEALVAHQGAVHVGFVLLQIIDKPLYIANISVLPEASGQGVGRLLLRAAEERAMELSAPAVTLATFKAPPWNGPWFRSLGYDSMPTEQIGSGLRLILDRHATFMDLSTRETLWKRLSRPELL